MDEHASYHYWNRFLALVRLRLGLFELDLANRFSLSQATVSRLTATWINLLYHALKGIERYPPWHIVKKYMPEAFRKDYPNTRIIIDATDFLWSAHLPSYHSLAHFLLIRTETL